MPRYQVTCRELVYIDRTYEFEASSPGEAYDRAEEFDGGSDLVDEQIQDTHSFCYVANIFDEHGNRMSL